jgi:hypothetical protein
MVAFSNAIPDTLHGMFRQILVSGRFITIFYKPGSTLMSLASRINVLKDLSKCAKGQQQTIQEDSHFHKIFHNELHGGRTSFGNSHMHIQFCQMITPRLFKQVLSAYYNFQNNKVAKQEFILMQALAEKLLAKPRLSLSDIALVRIIRASGPVSLDVRETFFPSVLDVEGIATNYETHYKQHLEAIHYAYANHTLELEKEACEKSFLCRHEGVLGSAGGVAS